MSRGRGIKAKSAAGTDNMLLDIFSPDDSVADFGEFQAEPQTPWDRNRLSLMYPLWTEAYRFWEPKEVGMGISQHAHSHGPGACGQILSALGDSVLWSNMTLSLSGNEPPIPTVSLRYSAVFSQSHFFVGFFWPHPATSGGLNSCSELREHFWQG